MHKQNIFNDTIKRIRASLCIALAILAILSACISIALHSSGLGKVVFTMFISLSPYLVFTFLFLTGLFYSTLSLLAQDKTIKASIGATLLGAISLTGIFLFDYTLFLDIPFLTTPSTTYLRHFSFEEVTTLNEEEITTWHMEGYSIDGGYLTIPIEEKFYAESRYHHTPSDAHYAKVTYLPHTKIVYDITFLKNAEEIPQPSNNLNEMSFLYEDKLYTIPMQVQDILDKGWKLDEATQPERTLAGRDDSSTITPTTTLWLKQENGDSLTITVYNKKENPIPIEEGMVSSISFFPSSSCLMPHNLIINWSTRDEVINTYGTPQETDEKTFLYSINDNTSIRFYFDENQYLTGFQFHTNPTPK